MIYDTTYDTRHNEMLSLYNILYHMLRHATSLLIFYADIAARLRHIGTFIEHTLRRMLICYFRHFFALTAMRHTVTHNVGCYAVTVTQVSVTGTFSFQRYYIICYADAFCRCLMPAISSSPDVSPLIFLCCYASTY